ncbi:MAG: cytochrome c3 family protein [candidate division KSB1 bacterium]|nr:cytochrome c3 family protein [candidate division KSB1 bacterium]MDQ7066398.1 cytochrome c3 family protein [candidate division KSB1 bacterium]
MIDKRKWALTLVMMAVWSLPVFAQAQQNPHKHLKRDCVACHTTSSFKEIIFDHRKTDFALEGHHQKLDCQQCHSLEDFNRVKNQCQECHEDVHRAKLGSNCERCHSVNGWMQFNIESIHEQTNFPILGRHVFADCQSCHPGLPAEDPALTPQRCESCHRTQYMEAANPNHIENGFSTNCQECHQMNGWQPGFYPGHDALFPIFTGEHASVWASCSTCHITQGFAVFSCFDGCHEHNQAAMDAKHRGMGGYRYESTACYNCHPNGSEDGLASDHDSQFFPIFSGTHASQWQACSDCHVSPGDFKQFSCIECHAHSQAQTDPVHAAITGYVYSSQSCYTCHPRGERGEFREHDTLFFPIYSGKHKGAWKSCADCHNDPGNRKVFTCIDCHAHSRDKMDAKHLGEVNGYRYESQACFNCHPQGRQEDN